MGSSKGRHALGCLVLVLGWAGPVSGQPSGDPGPRNPVPAPPAVPAPDVPEPALGGSGGPSPAPQASDTTLEGKLSALVARPGGLTSGEAARRAVATSRTVRQHEAEIMAAQAESYRSRWSALPRLDLIARYTRLSPVGRQDFGPDDASLVGTTEPPGALPRDTPLFGLERSALSVPDVLNHYLLQARATIPLSEYLLSTRHTFRAADSNEEVARLNREAEKAAVAAQAKLLYYEWARTRLQVVIAEKSVEQGQASLTMTQDAFSEGRGSKADVLNAESVLATATLTLEHRRREAATAEERLRAIMHDTADRREIGEDLLGKAGEARLPELTALVAEAQRNRLELRALDQAARTLAERSAVSRVQAWPKLEAIGNAYLSNPNPRYFPAENEWHPSWDVGAQLGWSPSDWSSSKADKRSNEAELAKLQAKRDVVVDEIQQEVFDAYASLREAELGIATAENNLRAAEEAYRVQHVFYENGRGTLLDLLNIEARLVEARVQIVDMRAIRQLARVSLDHAVGRDIPRQGTP